MSERRRALIIANLDYQDPILRPLISPSEDARELAKVLENPTIGGFEVETLLNENAGTVTKAIEEFLVFSDPKPDDLLLLYFSGHGITDEEGTLYFATTDTQFVRQSVRRASAVSADFVDGVMRRSRSRRQILLLDCCHGGAFAEGMRLKGPLPGLETHFQGRGRMVLTASTSAQFSLEGTSEAGQQQPSVYTRILVEGLKTGEADRDGDGLVSLDDLHDYLVDGVRAEAPQQTPTKSGYVEGQLYLARTFLVRPAELPRNLQNALKDSEVFARRGAVSELGELLRGEHPGLALAARQALEILRDRDDSFRIRSAAADCLTANSVKPSTQATVEPPTTSTTGAGTVSPHTTPVPVSVPSQFPASGRAISITPTSSSGRSEQQPWTSRQRPLLVGAVVTGLLWSVISFADMYLPRWIYMHYYAMLFSPSKRSIYIIAIATFASIRWCIAGLVFAIVLSRSAGELKKIHLALLTLIWPLVLGSTAVFWGWGGRPGIVFAMEQAVAGALTGLVLASALKSSRWGGLLMGAVSFGLIWSSLGVLISTHFSWGGVVFPTFVCGTLLAGLTIWYVDTHAKHSLITPLH